MVEKDYSNSSFDCVKTGLIEFDEKIVASKSPYEVFKRNASSFLFKTTQVLHYYEIVNNKSFIYIIYSDKMINDLPENSITAISCGENKQSIAGVASGAINNQMTGVYKIKNPIK